MIKTIYKIGAAAAVAAATLALAACGGSSGGPAPGVTLTPVATAPAAAPTPTNPVPLLRQAGATPDPGQVRGTYDFDGNLYAAGSYPGGVQTVTVRTMPDRAAYDTETAKERPDDQNALILVPGRLAYIVLTSAYGFHPSAAQVAARVGGTVAP
jgi:hypothetical protein